LSLSKLLPQRQHRAETLLAKRHLPQIPLILLLEEHQEFFYYFALLRITGYQNEGIER
jgi:hypothetical protein